jgi:hypothetical protein
VTERKATHAGGTSVRLDALHVARVIAFALLAYVVAVGVLVAVLGFSDVWYRFHDLSDTPVYLEYAAAMAHGLRPYFDFDVEYPPLAVQIFKIPGHTGDVLEFTLRFNAVMLATGALAAALTAACAARLWPPGRRAYATAAAFAACVVAIGAIIANRYDATVALVIAACLLLLASQHWTLAAAALGIGFALKLTPAILLPLVLVLAPARRARVTSALAFVAAAALPFVPYLGSAGLARIFTYHLERPLQIESVLATPILLGHLVGGMPAAVGTAYGSQFIAAEGTGLLARASGPLALAALALTYLLVWRRRAALRRTPPLVPLAALVVLLAPIIFGKVLSPQFLVWILPVIALVFPERPALAAVLATVLLLTQIEFPALYWEVVELRDGPMALVIVRNVALVAAFVLAVLDLRRVGAG